jgi:SAM-dependent methyltransferase
MHLADIVSRLPRPMPWSEGDNIPWHEPGFSARMLREHLSQAHDAASRRFELIDRHVVWLHDHILESQPTRILDLGCGPGLYASRLARLGHTCTGIDYSPASIAYAQEEARRDGLACEYRLEDIRRADYGTGFGAAMLLYGEFNVFRPGDVATILDRVHAALAPGGILVLEVSTFGSLRQQGCEGRSWYTAPSGLFSERPYLLLQESHWDEVTATATKRYYAVEAETAEVTLHAQTMQAYTEEQYRGVLAEHGFGHIRAYPSLTGGEGEYQPEFYVLVARRGSSAGIGTVRPCLRQHSGLT